MTDLNNSGEITQEEPELESYEYRKVDSQVTDGEKGFIPAFEILKVGDLVLQSSQIRIDSLVALAKAMVCDENFSEYLSIIKNKRNLGLYTG